MFVEIQGYDGSLCGWWNHVDVGQWLLTGG
jgi:hypothetical protein